VAAGLLGLLAAVGTVGYFYFTHLVATWRQSRESELSAIAQLKVRGIINWRAERLGDAKAVMSEPLVGQQVRENVDQAEISAPLRQQALTTGAAILAILLAAALGVALLWRHRDNRWLESRLAAEREQKEHFEGQRQAMEELYEAAESATRAKSEFLANMSHEIRTPMTAILGYADVLAGQLDNAEHLEALNIIRRNGDHLLAIINDILDFSKIEAGKFQVERQACSPAAVAAEVVSLMRVRARGKGLDLKLEFAGALPETVLTDPARLRQILLNLAGNAVKFTETGSVRIVVRLEGWQVLGPTMLRTAPGGEEAAGPRPSQAQGRATPDGVQPKLVCEVVDTGIGMTAAQIDNLFQPFQQAEASTARKFGGTGLGLAISKRLAKFLGGDIAVSSQPGQGSTFTLTIDPGPLAGVALVDHPSEAVTAPAARPAAGSPLPRLNCRILLAEDGLDNQRFISFLLKKAGAEVTTVDNGRKAMEFALATFPGWGQRHDDPRLPFDIVLMDMQMPVMDGYEATRRLRQEGYAGPVIALTAHAMKEDRQKCLDAGCDDYATKPIDRAKLLNLIAGMLEKKRPSATTGLAPVERKQGTNDITSDTYDHDRGRVPSVSGDS
jgi:signal transduction histidine kinase/CheY-like chemotaxis protein